MNKIVVIDNPRINKWKDMEKNNSCKCLSFEIFDSARDTPRNCPNTNKLLELLGLRPNEERILVFVHQGDIVDSNRMADLLGEITKCAISVVMYSSSVNAIKLLKNDYEQTDKDANCTPDVVFLNRPIANSGDPLKEFGDAIMDWIKGSRICEAMARAAEAKKASNIAHGNLLAFQVLWDVALLITQPDHSAFTLVPAEIKERAKDVYKKIAWVEYWEPLNTLFNMRSRELAEIAAKSGESQAKRLVACVDYVSKQRSKPPNPVAPCVKDYLDWRKIHS